jgi:hypothetical protein
MRERAAALFRIPKLQTTTFLKKQKEFPTS